MLKSLFGLFSRRHSTDDDSSGAPSMDSTPMRRWSQEELAAEKAALETRGATAPLTKEVAYRVTDYLVQRYLPADDERTELQWQEERTRLHARVDKALDEHHANPEAKPAWQAENEARAARHSQMQAPYGMSLEEFTTRVLATLCRFPFMSGVSHLPVQDATLLWRATFPLTDASTWSEKHEVSEAKDVLIGRYHPTVLEVCRMLRDNYELLRKAQAAGFAEVRVITSRECRCFRRLDGQKVHIVDALAAFEASVTAAPLLPPAESACARLESPSVCPVMLIPLEPPRERDDPEFATWLENHFRSDSR